jgi:hypothetical protein
MATLFRPSLEILIAILRLYIFNSSGFSSVIDFIDLRCDGQKSAVESAEWDRILPDYTKTYHVELSDLPDISSTALETAAKARYASKKTARLLFFCARF